MMLLTTVMLAVATANLFDILLGNDEILSLREAIESASIEELDQPNDEGHTPLIWASEQGRSEVVKILLHAGAPILSTDRDDGWTALAAASFSPFGQQVEVVQQLLKADPSPSHVNLGDKGGRTALMKAVNRNFTDIVSILLRAGADVNQRDQSKHSALLVAADGGHTGIARLLISAGADMNAADNYAAPSNYGRTALCIASIHGHNDFAEAMLIAGATVDPLDGSHWTPLFHAAGLDNKKLAKMLLKHGADATHQSKNGWNPLMVACKGAKRNKPRISLVRLLLAQGREQAGRRRKFDINHRDNVGCTALIIAASVGRSDVVKLLLDEGADPSIRDTENGLTALEVARNAKHVDVLRVFYATMGSHKAEGQHSEL
jgi:ankyrin repeat protein